jgi:hypothetical protein
MGQDVLLVKTSLSGFSFLHPASYLQQWRTPTMIWPSELDAWIPTPPSYGDVPLQWRLLGRPLEMGMSRGSLLVAIASTASTVLGVIAFSGSSRSIYAKNTENLSFFLVDLQHRSLSSRILRLSPRTLSWRGEPIDDSNAPRVHILPNYLSFAKAVQRGLPVMLPELVAEIASYAWSLNAPEPEPGVLLGQLKKMCPSAFVMQHGLFVDSKLPSMPAVHQLETVAKALMDDAVASAKYRVRAPRIIDNEYPSYRKIDLKDDDDKDDDKDDNKDDDDDGKDVDDSDDDAKVDQKDEDKEGKELDDGDDKDDNDKENDR